MEFSGTRDQAQEYARAALDLMSEKSIPATPGNFAIWFHYFSEKYPDLRHTLDTMLGQEHAFSEEENDELFQKFFGIGREAAALQEASQRIEAELSKILTFMDTAGEGAVAYGKMLESASGKIEAAEETGGLKSVITNLLTATRAMQQNNDAIGNRLQSSSHIVKPFSPSELTARVRAVLRRSRPELTEKILKYEGIEMDMVTHRVKRHERTLHLGADGIPAVKSFSRASRPCVLTRTVARSGLGP
ncbi:MAG: hypothetical protein ACKVHL_01340 [Rhodospirillales bacterium]